ncbi:MAG: NifB/NifX family molybdenum-iron cluster-binding protein [Clostridia bacterium]|nr:NifB/NifX family molybdenum-iron cluster-binding protein [Clostridia bacterium]
MKILITCESNHPQSMVDQRFGRCQYFGIYNQETEAFTFIENDGINANQGAGIATAQKAIDLQVNAILTGNIGPKAMDVLKAAGISGYVVKEGKVTEAVEQFIAGQLEVITEPSRG